MFAKSLPLKLSAYCGLALCLAFGIGAVVITSQSADAQHKQNAEIQLNLAKSQGEAVSRRLDLAAKAAAEIGSAAIALKESGATSRTTQDAVLKSVLERNPEILGAYTAYEPNALDGQDAKYSGTEGTDASGRFISYWNRGSGSIIREVLADYDKPGAGDYYQRPKNEGRAVAIEPYIYPVAGKPVLMTSFTHPLQVNGQFIGISGVDIDLGSLNAEMAKAKPFGTGFVALVSSTGLAVSHPDARTLGKPLAEIDPSTASAAKQAIESGKQVAFDGKGIDGKSWRYLALPIKAGATGDVWAVVVEVPVATLNADINRSLGNMILISLLSIVAALGALYVLISRMVGVPLRNLGSVIDRMAAGDHNAQVREASRSDEVGAIGKAVMSFRESLRLKAEAEAARERDQQSEQTRQRQQSMNELASQFETAVGGIVEMVSAAATEMQATAQQLTSTAQESAFKARSVSVAAEEAGTNVTSVAGAAEELGASVSEISRQVEHSLAKAREAVSEAETTRAIVHELSEASGRITGIVDMISGIAAQTNLLALNATIESARAGEAGRGFAVVASEVKTLAQQTAKATDEINQQIAAIQTTTTQAVAAIENISATIQALNDSSATIASAVQQQGGATHEIVHSVTRASAGASEVSSNISGVARMAEETGQGASQVLSASSELAQQAERLQGQVHAFLAQVRSA
ncbi:methyl-accepting chemotaxis protein [Asticcacaulis sp. DXS10W]|uniref:Methyl-accepting chemotaxis protein n=1 Tax=Asticcacaulis currens TaxID=2984210 RepID=A0ABT5IDE5_9CAUL|nr:methyl-accepting chemotaxis protein [Asticcacaulis currens]MDC7694203.1 methyl-accepting chemotaxis protein [Asticcacaulis currens]